MQINFIDLKRQQDRIHPEIDRAIASVLNSGNYVMGEQCKELENKLADYVGVKHCLGCANGTDAIRLALVSLGIKPDDMVLTTNFTFFATSEVIVELGAIPIFVDVDDTYNMCPIDLDHKAQQLSTLGFPIKGIVSVDLFGLPANHLAINKTAEKYNLWHLEDGAQGFGGKIADQVNCSFGDISTTSFFPAKPLGCYGDGGAIFTNNDDFAEHIKSLRVHGKGSHKYENIRIGYNSRLDTIQAAILIEKLKIFNDEIDARNNLAILYNSSFSHIEGVSVPVVPDGFISSWAQYSLVVEDRDDLVEKLTKKGIPTAIYYPKTMSQTKALLEFKDFQLEGLSNSEKLCKKIISLPMHAYFTKNEKDYIVESVLSALS